MRRSGRQVCRIAVGPRTEQDHPLRIRVISLRIRCGTHAYHRRNAGCKPQPGIAEAPEEFGIDIRIGDIEHKVRAVERAGHPADSDCHRRCASAGRTVSTASSHAEPPDQNCPPAVRMVCVRREDPHIRHRRLEIHVVDMGVIGPGQPLQLRQELIGNEPPELVPERTAAAVVGGVLRVPSMLDHGGGGHIVALVVVPAVEGVQHSVVRADIDDFTAIFPSHKEI